MSMKKMLFYTAFLILANSCQNKANRFYVDKYKNNQKEYEYIAKFISNNWQNLYSSNCHKSGRIVLSKTYVEIDSCCPLLQKELSSITQKELFIIAEAYDIDAIQFKLSFKADDISMTESTKYFIYVRDGELPNIYKRWIGDKIKIDDNWWFVEYTDSQY